MFTINIFLRFGLIVAGLALGLLLTFLKGLGFWYGFPFLLLAVVLLLGYFLMGTVMSTGKMLSANDIEGARKRLALTKFPNMLFPQNKSVYHLIKGNIGMYDKDYETAEKHLTQSLDMPFPSDNEKAGVYLNLAMLYFEKKKFNLTTKYLKDLKKMKITEPYIAEKVKELDNAMKQKSMLRRPGGMQQMANKSKKRKFKGR